MKFLGWAIVVDAILWVLIVLMSAFGVGHPDKATWYLGPITGILLFLVLVVAAGMQEEDDE